MPGDERPCAGIGHHGEVVGFPDYLLRRPAEATKVDVAAFERLYDELVAPGNGTEIAYRLTAPRWQFLCWLTDTKDVVLHGSGHPAIDEFEPRQADDVGEFGARRAVYAASDGIWPIYFAVADRHVVTSLVNGCVRRAGDRTTETYYYFSVNREALAATPWHAGTVYVLPRDSFEAQPEDDWRGSRLASTQWASPVAVKPIARLAVTPGDFPFLDQVRGHDQDVVAVRAARDPDAFPWLDQ